MKRCLVLLVLFMAFACVAATAENVELELAHFSFFGDVSDNPAMKDQYISEFEKKFGIKIKMNLIPRNNYLEKLNLMVASGELHGIIRVFSPSDVLKFIDDGVIEPFDAYVADNKIFKTEFDSIGNVFRYNGKIWGIMNGYEGNPFVRYWRQDWLDKLKLKVPSTIDELYTAAKMFTENDPDGNGVNDTVGLTGASVGWNIQDIFQAYNARLNDIGGNTIAYDPLTGAWDDSMLKPGMVDALTMLNKLYKNGYLDAEFATNKGSNMRDRLVSGKYGSAFYWAQWGVQVLPPLLQKNIPEARISIAPVTTGTRKTLVNQFVGGGTLHVLIKGTKNPKGVVNAFVNTFFGSVDGMLWGKYGVEGVAWKREGGKIIQLKDPKTGNLMPTAGISTVIAPFDVDRVPVVPEGPAVEQDLAISQWKYIKSIAADGFKNKTFFDASGIRDNPFSATYNTLSSDIDRLCNEAIIKATTGELSPKEAIADYRAAMKKMDAQKALTEMNEFLSKATGKVVRTTYTY
jgi:ABC-type glycerol-3-phosphate transport system substrate-binding protein